MPLPIAGRELLRQGTEHLGIVARHRRREGQGQGLGIGEQLAERQIAVASAEVGVLVNRSLEGPRGQTRRGGANGSGVGREAASQVPRRRAERWMAHEPESTAPPVERGGDPYDAPMSEPGEPRPQPGDQPPSSGPGGPTGTRLERAPSERYRVADARRPATAGRDSAAGPIAAAAGVAIAGAAALTVILGVLLSTSGTFVVSTVAGAAIGLLVSGAAAGPSAPLSRDRAVRVAVGLALGMVVLAGLAIWILARSEGGVMDPVGYLWTTFGFGIPAQALVAVIASAWGAASGPIRWRE